MNTQWNTENPPKDGTIIVAIGKVVWMDGAITGADPLLAEISWCQPKGGHLGWHFTSGMSVATSTNDEVIIHYWMPCPTEPKPCPVAQMVEHSAAHFDVTSQMTATMPVICSWCQGDMGTKPCVPEMAGKPTHSCCAACQNKFFADLKSPEVVR